MLWTAQQLESSIGDASAIEDLKNTNELKAESTHWNGKETAVLSGSCSFIDQEYGRKEESFGNNKILNLLFIFNSSCIKIFLTLLLPMICTIPLNFISFCHMSLMFDSGALITIVCSMFGDSIVSTSQATFIDRDTNTLLEEDLSPFDSVLPERCTVNTSKSSLSFENNSSFLVGEDQTENKEDKVSSVMLLVTLSYKFLFHK